MPNSKEITSDQLTLFAEDSHVPTSVRSGNKQVSVKKQGQDFGQNVFDYLGTFDPSTGCLRIPQRCLVDVMGNGFSKFCETSFYISIM